MKIYLPSKELRAHNALLKRVNAETALRQWHPRRVLFARLAHDDVRILETLDRRLDENNQFEFRSRRITNGQVLGGNVSRNRVVDEPTWQELAAKATGG